MEFLGLVEKLYLESPYKDRNLYTIVSYLYNSIAILRFLKFQVVIIIYYNITITLNILIGEYNILTRLAIFYIRYLTLSIKQEYKNN